MITVKAQRRPLSVKARAVRRKGLPPEKIPPHIVVDVSKLGLDEAILVRDLPWPEGVRPLLPPEDAVVVVVPPKVEAAPAEGPAAEAPAPEAPAEAPKPEPKKS
jgi:large subunit ribosomal protein L25